MKLKPDKMLRDRWFVPEAMTHPAKGHLGLWWEIFERYTKPGQWVLDPMAGIGSTMIGAMMGRNVICNEMEEHFIMPMRASWAKMRQQVMLGCELGEVVILQGDARCLPLGRADCVVTSPPWEDKVAMGDMDWIRKHDPEIPHHVGKGDTQKTHNRKTLEGYTRPAAVITSPPYEGSIQGEPGIDFSKMDGGKRDMTKEAAQDIRLASLSGYTRPVDAVVTSPPFGEVLTGGVIAAAVEGQGNYQVTTRMPGSVYSRRSQSQAPNNIGNERGQNYWDSMKKVYAECHRVLAPGGVMVLVVKGYTRDGQYVDLPQQTVECCEALGFRLRERWERELWGLSFWRILQKRKSPDTFDDRLNYESVLVLRKRDIPSVE